MRQDRRALLECIPRYHASAKAIYVGRKERGYAHVQLDRPNSDPPNICFVVDRHHEEISCKEWRHCAKQKPTFSHPICSLPVRTLTGASNRFRSNKLQSWVGIFSVNSTSPPVGHNRSTKMCTISFNVMHTMERFCSVYALFSFVIAKYAFL